MPNVEVGDITFVLPIQQVLVLLVEYWAEVLAGISPGYVFAKDLIFIFEWYGHFVQYCQVF